MARSLRFFRRGPPLPSLFSFLWELPTPSCQRYRCGPAFTCCISSAKGTIGTVRRKGRIEMCHWLFCHQQMP